MSNGVKYFLLGLIAGALLIIFLPFGKTPEIVVRDRVDTVTVYQRIKDTVILTETRLISRVDTILVQVPGDTIRVAVTLPFEAKVFRTENYKAFVSGYKPMLDSIELFIPTKIITNERVVTKIVPPKWQAGVVVGAQFAPNGNNQYFGARVQYTKGLFSIEGVAGYNPFTDSPYGEIRGGINLFRK